MYGKLAAMGIEINTNKEKMTDTLNDNELEKILEDTVRLKVRTL